MDQKMERTILHILGGESRSRAEQARLAFALGHHAEVYADLAELIERPPHDGIIVAADTGEPDMTRNLIDRLGERGIWLPVVMVAQDPDIDRVVAAIKAGALDYLRLPLEMGALARRLGTILGEAGEHAMRRKREVEAQHRITLLSRRERQVLELLSAGCANKEIGRRLEISPRTVEIHRGNMMAKLDAGHAADAVRLWLDAQQGGGSVAEAGLGEPQQAAEAAEGDESWPEDAERRRKCGQRQ
jgi:FixJ family two-component response regulator